MVPIDLKMYHWAMPIMMKNGIFSGEEKEEEQQQ